MNVLNVVTSFLKLDRGSAGWAIFEALLGSGFLEHLVVLVLLAGVAIHSVKQRLASCAGEFAADIVHADCIADVGSRVFHMRSRAEEL